MTTRTRRNLARTTGLALVAAALLLLGQTNTAGAAGAGPTLKAQGWWWRAAPLPAPPNVQKGQLYVQGNPSDPNGTAYAAVRYELETGMSVSTLTLKVGANGDQGGSSAVVLACRTGSAWSPAEGGDWSAAPKVDTKSCATGQRSDDGTSWTFAVTPLQTGTVIDLAIVPGVDPQTHATSTFALTFDSPKNESLAATSGSSGSTPSSFSTPSTFSTAGSPSGAGSTSGVGAPSGGVHPPAAASVPTGLPTDKVGQTATAPANQQASQQALNSALNPTSSSADKPNKTAGYIVLAFAALVGLYAYRQDNLMARNGGVLPGAKEEVGGLGRFTKPRTGQPPALT